jgi:RecA/RadA recombinase
MALLHAGEASAGKSNMCLQLLLNAQLPLAQGGFDGGAM